MNALNATKHKMLNNNFFYKQSLILLVFCIINLIEIYLNYLKF